MIAAAASVVVYPVYKGILRVSGEGKIRKDMAAIVTVLGVLIIILVPIFFLVGGIYSETQTLYGTLTDEGSRSHIITTLDGFSQSLSHMVFGVLPAYSFDSFNVTQYIKEGLQLAFSNLDAIFKSLAQVSAYVLIFLLALFYFLRDGKNLKNKAFSFVPLLEANNEHITHTLKRAIRSVFAGTLAVAVLDGISIGLAFLVFGIPAPALWGTVAAVASLIPGFGVSLVILPSALYFLFTGDYAFMAGTLIWGYATIFIVDHIVGPNLVNTGVKIHPFIVLLSVLGGLLTFGIVGFIMGPLVLVVLFTLLEVYKKSLDSEKV